MQLRSPRLIAATIVLLVLSSALRADIVASAAALTMPHQALSALQGPSMPAQIPAPSDGLSFVQLLSIPGWTVANASHDIFAFDPISHVLWFGDRVNHAASAIITGPPAAYSAALSVSPPGCVGASCVSGVLVAPDLRKLVVTDRAFGVFIYDISAVPAGPPVLQQALVVPNIAGGTDEMDYNPLNHRVYVQNTTRCTPPTCTAPFQLTVIDLTTNAIVDQIPLPTNAEQPRFNPVDGFIYQNITDEDNGGAQSSVLRIDPSKAGAAAIIKTIPVPGCQPHGIDIDVTSNTALLGCNAGPQTLLDLSADTVIPPTFPQVNGTDVLLINRNVRHGYAAASTNSNNPLNGCPADTTPPAFPVVGVFSLGPAGSRTASVVGDQCSGRNSHGLGVDPFQNNVFVGTKLYPISPPGGPGVIVFHDPSPPAQAPVTTAFAVLRAVVAGVPAGTVSFARAGNQVSVQTTGLGLPPSPTAELVITTTVGNEVVPCPNGSICTGLLLGDPLIGGVAILAFNGLAVARGTIAAGAAPPTVPTPTPTSTPVPSRPLILPPPVPPVAAITLFPPPPPPLLPPVLGPIPPGPPPAPGIPPGALPPPGQLPPSMPSPTATPTPQPAPTDTPSSLTTAPPGGAAAPSSSSADPTSGTRPSVAAPASSPPPASTGMGETTAEEDSTAP